MSFVKHYPRGHISCTAKRALYEALNGDEQSDFENNEGLVYFKLSGFTAVSLNKGYR